MKKELLEGLSDEQIEKIKACKTSEEVLTLAKKEGIELTEEQLEAVSGGCGTSQEVQCPECGYSSRNVEHWDNRYYRCRNCNHIWLKPQYDY
ncbi:MAG: hypothetical protein K6B65_06925 [Bacilli bacterium]|nr:hypothetical protein [Bacilli bacterium]